MPRRRAGLPERRAISLALKQTKTGTPVAEVLPQMGASKRTLYRWKKLNGGSGVGELRRSKQLEEENCKLKQLVADLSLDKHVPQNVLAKKSGACLAARGRRIRSVDARSQRAAEQSGSDL